MTIGGGVSLSKEETQALIKETAKFTAEELMEKLRTGKFLRGNKKTAFQKTEQLLYNYQSFKAVISDKEEQIKNIIDNGRPQRSKSIINFSPALNAEYLSELEKDENKIEQIQNSIAITKHYIAIVDRELEKLSHDYYYDLIRLLYFEGKTQDEAAEYYNCSQRTIWRNKQRLINKLRVMLFSDDVIKELFEY
jgi:DNA-directed RNA polymerase specialized sigma subunit